MKAVTNRKEWEEVSEEIDGDPAEIKRIYRKYIFPYEKRNYFGQENYDDEPNMVLGIPRKIVKLDYQAVKPKN